MNNSSVRLKDKSLILSYLFLLIIAVIFISCEGEVAKKPLKISSLFSNKMVIQQRAEVAFWGEYTPNDKITITGSWGTEAIVKADANGKWNLKIMTPEAGGPYTVKIHTGDSTIEIMDVLVGEVWLASGQSNMEMPLKGWPPNDPIENSQEEIANSENAFIRMFKVQRNYSAQPIDQVTGKWQTASPETSGEFSATAYFFARRLQKETGVPIGIIHSSWGGTVAEAWTSKKRLITLGDFDKPIQSMADTSILSAAEKWFDKWDSKDIPITESDWDNIEFDDIEASQLYFNDASWPRVNLPGRFDLYESGELDGVFWLRKNINIKDVDSDYILYIEFVDDMDATYFNGQKIGGLTGAGKYNLKREFVIPKSIIKNGKNTLAIRAVDTGGNGSIGMVKLSNKSTKLTTLMDGEWKYLPVAEIYENRFYVYALDNSGFTSRPDIVKLNPNIPTVLFNGMISPIIPYKIKGAIWYQGESNVGRAEQYKRLFPAMIEDWRSYWGYDFPFYFVQIAPYRYHQDEDVSLDQSQKLRDAQRVSLSTKNTGMVVTMDIGNFTNIHPANKQDVGGRLAGLALANDYGKELVPSGPLYKSFTKSGNTLILDFDFIGSGLTTSEKNLSGFEIAGADKKFVPAKAIILDNKVEVSSAAVNSPEYVRYAWRDNGIATLFNKEGLPASSFSTED